MSSPVQVLLVEDDEELRRALTLVLGARGFEVEGAGDASTALRALDERSFGAVVTDLGLPDLDGEELVRELRARAPDARLVVFTGRGEEEVEPRCRRAGADSVLTKPVSGDRLADVLQA